MRSVYVGKRLTIKEAREFFSERGYLLLEDKYISAKTRMKFECPKHKGRDNMISIASLKADSECYYCSREKVALKRKVKFSDVEKAFNNRGYMLLEGEGAYINNKTPLAYQCNTHPDKKLEISYNNLTKGAGCIYCAGKRKLTFEDVLQDFEALGLILISDEFVDSQTNMQYRCAKHYDTIQELKPNSVQQGVGCKFCGIEKNSGEGNANWDGGKTEINAFLREKLHAWRYANLKKCKNVCDVTGKKSAPLHVHHLKAFHEIRDEALTQLSLEHKKSIGEYTSAELKSLSDVVLEAHKAVGGVTLQADIHRLFHKEYGFKTNKDDYEEFKARYLRGEFDAKIT